MSIQRYINTMKYYSLKLNEVLRFTTTWMNLKNFMLSEISQTQNTTQYVIPFL